MSRIWDSLKDLERRQKRHLNRESAPAEAAFLYDRRCSERVRVCLPIFVYGHSVDHGPFYEGTELLCANSMGGLITLQTAVTPRQKLLLTNRINERELECRVVGLRSDYLNRFAIAIAFPEALPDFWSGAE